MQILSTVNNFFPSLLCLFYYMTDKNSSQKIYHHMIIIFHFSIVACMQSGSDDSVGHRQITQCSPEVFMII